MLGAIGIVVFLLVFPVALLMGGALAAGLVGQALKDDAEQRYPGSELIDLNR